MLGVPVLIAGLGWRTVGFEGVVGLTLGFAVLDIAKGPYNRWPLSRVGKRRNVRAKLWPTS